MGGNRRLFDAARAVEARWSRVTVPYGRALEEKDTGMSGVSPVRKGQLLTRFGHSIMVRAQDRLRSHPASGLVSPCARSPAPGAVRVPASPTFIDHGHQQAVPCGGQCRCACQSAGTRPAGPGTDWSSG
jgi:hypothetical protein